METSARGRNARGSAASSSARSYLPARARVKRRSEFVRVQSKGRKVQSRHLLVLFEPSSSRITRLGITVTTKVDRRATRRNLFKRRLREIFRLNRNELRGSFDIVVIARQNAPERSYRELEEEFLSLLRRAELMTR